MHPLKELMDVVGRGLQRFGDGLAAAGAKLGDIFHSLGEQLRRNMCASDPMTGVLSCEAMTARILAITQPAWLQHFHITIPKSMCSSDFMPAICRTYPDSSMHPLTLTLA